jgi:hypothetical protein
MLFTEFGCLSLSVMDCFLHVYSLSLTKFLAFTSIWPLQNFFLAYNLFLSLYNLLFHFLHAYSFLVSFLLAYSLFLSFFLAYIILLSSLFACSLLLSSLLSFSVSYSKRKYSCHETEWYNCADSQLWLTSNASVTHRALKNKNIPRSSSSLKVEISFVPISVKGIEGSAVEASSEEH